jgi:hypothetical protein
MMCSYRWDKMISYKLAVAWNKRIEIIMKLFYFLVMSVLKTAPSGVQWESLYGMHGDVNNADEICVYIVSLD